MSRHVVLIYGGASTENEVSCRSASTILRHLIPREKLITLLAADQNGDWYFQDIERQSKRSLSGEVLEIQKLAPVNHLESLSKAQQSLARRLFLFDSSLDQEMGSITVFSIIHGTTGEDGALQGWLELAKVAYVGSDLCASAVGMDKGISKRLAQLAQVPVAPFIEIHAEQWPHLRSQMARVAEQQMHYPIFVKPARLGSSVGISRVCSDKEFLSACEEAFTYDDKIIIEQGLDVREIECAMLGGILANPSTVGEVIPKKGIYDYESKYLDPDAALIKIPAKLSPEQKREVHDICKRLHQVLGLYGMARIDLFLERGTQKFYFNEVNTAPGFTNISQYPMLWQHSGVSPEELIQELLRLAEQRFRSKMNLQRIR